MSSPARAILAGVGPMRASLPAPTGTAPLTASGILNLSLSTSVTKVLSGSPGGLGGKARKVKITLITNTNALAYSHVNAGATAPVFTADYAGTSTVGSLVLSQETLLIDGSQDLYLVASAASTICQIHVEEV